MDNGDTPTATSAQKGDGTSGHTYLMATFVSDAFAGPVYIRSGAAVGGVLGIYENNADFNGYLRIHAWVTQGDSSTPRGTICTYEDADECSATATQSGEDIDSETSDNTIAAQTGDRLVIEVGVKANTTGTQAGACLYYGGNGSDLTDGGDPTTKIGYFTIVTQDVPTVTALDPTETAENTTASVTITGTNFLGATGVTVGGHAATSVSVASATSITCTFPAHAVAADEDVVVTTPAGVSAHATAAHFDYYEDLISNTGQGTVTVGTVSVTASSGKLKYTGAGAVSINPVTISSGTASHIIIVSESGVTVSTPSVSGAGHQNAGATGVATTSTPQVAGAGTVILSGSGLLTASGPTVSGSGIRTPAHVYGSGSLTTNTTAASGAGTDHVVGTGTVSLHRPAVSDGRGSVERGVFGVGLLSVTAAEFGFTRGLVTTRGHDPHSIPVTRLTKPKRHNLAMPNTTLSIKRG